MAKSENVISKERVLTFDKKLDKVKKEVGKAVIGQEKVIDMVLTALMANGNILLEGVPGIAKTLIMRTISEVMGCKFSRIQFTPDLLPTDIIGLTTYEKGRGFYVLKGPVFANFVLADEINRAPPKVQSALLEAMQEKQATIGKETFPLPAPFFVLATQNPLENVGTYPLPEAQMDRFIFKLFISYPEINDEIKILRNNITIQTFEKITLSSILSPQEIIELQDAAKKIYVDERIQQYIVKIVDATRNPSRYNIKMGKYVQWGASPRGSIGIYIASMANALLNGKNFVTPEHVKDVVPHVLNHRIILNYEGASENIDSFDVIDEILSKIPIP
jgi:MoxR-like ATPase